MFVGKNLKISSRWLGVSTSACLEYSRKKGGLQKAYNEAAGVDEGPQVHLTKCGLQQCHTNHDWVGEPLVPWWCLEEIPETENGLNKFAAQVSELHWLLDGA